MFAEAGTVAAVDVIMDRQTGKPKGFAFVTMSDQAEAEKAISLYDAKDFKSRTLKVNIAKPREERPAGDAKTRTNRIGQTKTWHTPIIWGVPALRKLLEF
jgi:RNA recognition motif-containing protein